MTKSVVIYTSPTCGPCKTLKPELVAQSIARGFSVVAIEASQATQQSFIDAGVRAVPTVVLLDGEAEIDRFAGAKTPQALSEQLDAWGL